MKRVAYCELRGGAGFRLVLAALGLVMGLGLASAWVMEHYGHVVTGMDNQVVWGAPHVFAVFLIVAASGALNVASVGSVFDRALYKPMARLSALLAIALLVGGLAVLVLDLGRPERLVVAMTSYNFRSIFAWNIFLYTGFLALAVAYLIVMMGRGLGGLAKPVGLIAFLWRLLLTTGTGSIFGWLVAREAYDAAVMAPLFIAMSLAFGTAIFILLLAALVWASGRVPDTALLVRLGRLMGIFVAAVLYFVAVQHLTNLYAAEHAGLERFLLVNGGVYPLLFWTVQVGLGSVVPLGLVLLWRPHSPWVPMLAAALVIVGGFAQVYVTIIGGQAYPLELIPGRQVSSSFGDGSIAAYTPSMPEVGLGLGGVALALVVVLIGVRALRILPENLTGDQAEVAAAPDARILHP
ncbi:MAG: molybdopterin oxidoreductase [Hyphomicrobiaceae bacterium]|nr:MAG: molybdopterin oxidoreductase [Hyphomicrobiaceae bacterium]